MSVLFVAEVGSAHKGSKSLAFEYIRAFSEAGAGAIKFQFGWTKAAQEAQGLEYNPVRYVDEWVWDLRKWCDSYGVKLMASIWSEEGLETANMAPLDIYKVGYRMKDGSLAIKVRKAAVERDKPLYISGYNVHCISKYPTYPNELLMPDKFEDGVIGYSDHTHGIEACLLAVARGATYIEKHVALDKTDLVTKDTPFSATPQEFEDLVKIGNGIERILNANA